MTESFQQLDLPVIEVAEELLATLATADEVVLEAPPGAGKTTLVPLLLKDSPWLAGRKILMLEPRRVAARAAAHRMAGLLEERAGETVGYRVRMESRVSAKTQIEVITEGILTRMLQTDPALDDVGLLIFDEFHERSIDSDLGLALALQGRELFRDEALKILVMSATLDGTAVAGLLGDAPVLRSEGRQYPVEVIYGDRQPWGQPVIDPLYTLLCRVMRQPGEGSVLVFLPGRAEIRQLQQKLPEFDNVEVLPLHGGLELAAQQRAIAPAAAGIRKLVLATNIAETSLTIDGVDTVVDCGLAREPGYDPGTAMTRLRTARISRASAEQRAGRAGRLRPGRCFRLWSESQHQELAPQGNAGILQADLVPLALQLLAWGVSDPAELAWLDPPPAGAWAQAIEFLEASDVFDSGQEWVLNARGEELARLPVHPRLGLMLLAGRELGLGEAACYLAALLGENWSGAGEDLGERLAMVSGQSRPPRDREGTMAAIRKQAGRLLRLLGEDGPGSSPSAAASAPGLLVAAAFPDRIARRSQPGRYQLSNGRRANLPLESSLAGEEWLAVAELGGRAGHREDRIYAAVALDEPLLEQELSYLVRRREVVEWDEQRDQFVAEERLELGRILVSARRLHNVDPERKLAALVEMLRQQGLDRLPWNESDLQWRARVALLRETLGEPWPDVSEAALLESLEQWLGPWLDGVGKPADLQKLELGAILANLLPWPLPRQLDELAPQRLQVPSGSSVAIDYSNSPPVLAVKLQEMFGARETPAIVRGEVPLLVHLLSPAGRPLQVTQDLAGFWEGAYSEVRKEMKGRYPKHPWPEDPQNAQPTRHTRHRRPTGAE